MRKIANTFGEFHLLVGAQRFLHELLLGKADPPLAGLAVFGVEDFFAHSIAGFLSQLR
jgi:hypothetical protein